MDITLDPAMPTHSGGPGVSQKCRFAARAPCGG